MKNSNFLLVCNFKNNAVDIEKFKSVFDKKILRNLVICPNFCEILSFFCIKNKNLIQIGAQNVSQTNASQTGETTVEILRKYNVDFCIVGHSERRKFFLEDSKTINEKLKLLLQNNITPILCVGENLAEFSSQTDYAKDFVAKQLKTELQGIDKSKVIVAYEPIWAIGTGKVANQNHIESVCNYIKETQKITKCLYGGSVSTQNFKLIAEIACIDGVLIGKASLNAENLIYMQNVLIGEDD